MASTRRQALLWCCQCLEGYSDSVRLDAELLLVNVCCITRSALYSDPNTQMTAEQTAQLDVLLDRRVAGEPLAYILGVKEFYDLELTVTPAVLIPRPDTEALIDWILQSTAVESQCRVADLGTGSGAIALTLAQHRANWTVFATDVSHVACDVARENRERLGVSVTIDQGDWCAALPPQPFDWIISNPPYIAAGDSHLDDLSYEPEGALVAGRDGLDEIRKIIVEAQDYLKPGGRLVLEHGWQQAEAVRRLLLASHYEAVGTGCDLGERERFSFGQKVD